jgi:D-alanine-D-alanine ligase
LEVNTQPGMTPTSLVPEQAAYLGMGYDDLVKWIVEDASCPR